jgi:CRISPR-associated endonuclease/helicase Cas3
MIIDHPYRRLWAKTNRATGEIHPLIYHLIDVGSCALSLWKQAFPESTRNYFSQALQTTDENACNLIAFLNSLHDLGKACPNFQSKYPPVTPHLLSAGFTFPDARFYEPHAHGLVTSWAVEPLLKDWGMPARMARYSAIVLGGHHGSWPTPGEILSPHRKSNLGGGEWEQARQAIFETLLNIFKPQHGGIPDGRKERNALLTMLSGYITIADWLGSMQNHFLFTDPDLPIAEYIAISRQRAANALKQTGWEGWQPSGSMESFHGLFGFLPYPVQSQAIEIASQLDLPALVIIEAPTGSGKTETAFSIADQWIQRGNGRGVYVAMPTQATSNQMFDRTRRFLEIRYPHEPVNLQLTHGQAILSERLEQILLGEIGEEAWQRVAALSWFLPKKRGLLAPFGVGTVDQVFLSVLQTRHHFVRQFGLAHKVVIFDEVHAYDTYMSELMWRLLAWLRSTGTSVILLSATLPESTRRRLASAYLGEELEDLPPVSYPRLLAVSGDHYQMISLPCEGSRRVKLRWKARDPAQLVDLLSELIQMGGCAAVICNTIGRAQEVYRYLKEASIVPVEDCMLFHARFPYAWRMEKENEILASFGKEGNRPQKAIVVATQVIEQSLDLDFDLIVSELAPIDLIIQRVGRLHRHKRDSRPEGLSEPTLVLLSPGQSPDGGWDFENDGFIYEEYLLLRTLASLNGKSTLSLPDDSTHLIETVYNDGKLATGLLVSAEMVEKTRKEMEKRREEAAAQARLRLVLPPNHEDLLMKPNLGLKEDSSEVHHSLRALTRLAEPGITLICLHRRQDGSLHTDSEGSTNTIVALEQEPDHQTIKKLLMSSLTVQHPALVQYFSEQPGQKCWERIPALLEARPVIFESGVCRLSGTPYILELHREFGLIIRKERL